MSRRGIIGRAASVLAVMATVAGLATAPTASAELQNPRQDWLRGSQAGLFLHWGMRTSPGFTSCSAWESAVTNGGWTPQYWVNEAKKLHTQYLVFASFHSRLGYARAYPSKIPGSCATKRDFLGETIKAAGAAGLKVMVYMTDDPQWHNEGGHEWLDSSGYSSYKGHSVNLSNRDGFGEFSYDNFVEVMQRYPKADYPALSGFWIDNDNAYWETHGLYQRVQQDRPEFLLSNNNEDTPIMDTISNEQKTGMTPSYDYPQAVYTAAPRLTEACYKLPSGGSWWFSGSNSTVDIRLNVGRYITNSGSSIKSNMAETAMVNGKFPSNQESYNNFLNSYLDQIWESIDGTEGGGYMYGGLQPGFWNDGAHGVTTIKKNNPNLQYIHVLTKPSTSTLRVRDNGYKVSKVTNLRTGAAVSFAQSGGTITLSGVSNWDQYDTVFKVETSGREGIYSGVTMSASASASGHAASAAGDGNYLTYWDSNKTTPVSLQFDLGSAKKIQYVGINQREDSVSYARSSTEQSARIKEYRVFVSADGSNWGSAVKTGTLPSHRGVQFIDIPATTARHVRVEVVSTYAASSDSTRFKRLRIDEAWIGSDYVNAAGGQPEPNPARYEAENAMISNGVVEANHAGFSGTGFVNYANAPGGYVEWTVNAAGGPATLRLGYANGTADNRPVSLAVNGTTTSDVNFPGTGAWTTYTSVATPVTLAAGANIIRATATTATGGPNADYLEVG